MAVPVVDVAAFRNRTRVFRDRRDAGRVLAELLAGGAAENARILASGITLRATIAALRRAGCTDIVVAVPTAHLRSLGALDESEVLHILQRLHHG